MAFPNKVVKENFKSMGTTAILQRSQQQPINTSPSNKSREASWKCHFPKVLCRQWWSVAVLSPAVEQGFLPRPELVCPGRYCISKLHKLAAEGDLAQEQHKGVQPWDGRWGRHKRSSESAPCLSYLILHGSAASDVWEYGGNLLIMIQLLVSPYFMSSYFLRLEWADLGVWQTKILTPSILLLQCLKDSLWHSSRLLRSHRLQTKWKNHYSSRYCCPCGVIYG